MEIRLEQCIPEKNTWNEQIAPLPGAHFLQTWEWSEVKAGVGWQPVGCLWRTDGQICAAALVLQRSLRLGGVSTGVKILYAPKGPLLDWNCASLRQQVLQDLEALARQRGAIFVKLDPDVSLGSGIPGSPGECPNPAGLETQADLQARGWVFSRDQIQFRNTAMIDLRPSEEEILARMKQKTRYNIRLAEKKGVTIRMGGAADLRACYRMYAETSVRDGFVIREEGYYLDLWARFLQAGLAEIFLAEVEGNLVAGLIIFRFAGRSWYFYGMSRDLHREWMPNYLLQWEAMRRSKQAGCLDYDLWGAPEEFNENDPLWGVFRFKEGLGAQVVRWIGAWDYPVHPGLYRLYTQTLPHILEFMRRRRRASTHQEVNAL